MLTRGQCRPKEKRIAGQCPLSIMQCRNPPNRPVIVSIHDVMPANLVNIMKLIAFLKAMAVRPITLLIVPGAGWRPADISILRRLHASGIELAGHGWSHRIGRCRTAGHRLHGFFISRNEAEHLSLSPAVISRLIEKSHNWFRSAGLPAPALYVPPAWAMGPLPENALQALPYRYYETLLGVYDSHRGQMHPMAVCGYMADTGMRLLFLRLFNWMNRCLTRHPLRIAIHPDDLSLPMAKSLAADLKKASHFSGYPLRAAESR